MELWIIGSIFGARTNIAVHAYLGALFHFSGWKFVSITLALMCDHIVISLRPPLNHIAKDLHGSEEEEVIE